MPASPSSGQRWPDGDLDLHAYVDATVDLLCGVLGSRLVGVWLHGSLAMGCYHRPESDLDLIVVSADRIDPDPGASDDQRHAARTRERSGP